MNISGKFTLYKAHENLISSVCFNPCNDKILATSCKNTPVNLT